MALSPAASILDADLVGAPPRDFIMNLPEPRRTGVNLPLMHDVEHISTGLANCSEAFEEIDFAAPASWAARSRPEAVGDLTCGGPVIGGHQEQGRLRSARKAASTRHWGARTGFPHMLPFAEHGAGHDRRRCCVG